MCDAKPGLRCATDTRDTTTKTLAAYEAAHPAGPTVSPLDRAVAVMERPQAPATDASQQPWHTQRTGKVSLYPGLNVTPVPAEVTEKAAAARLARIEQHQPKVPTRVPGRSVDDEMAAMDARVNRFPSYVEVRYGPGTRPEHLDSRERARAIQDYSRDDPDVEFELRELHGGPLAEPAAAARPARADDALASYLASNPHGTGASPAPSPRSRSGADEAFARGGGNPGIGHHADSARRIGDRLRRQAGGAF